MSEWWTYSLQDFLLFSPRVYWRTIELDNEIVWPLHLVTLCAGAMCAFLIIYPGGWSASLICSILAAVWLWVAWSFLWNRYATINWAAAYAAPVFVCQALLLVWSGLVRGRFRFDTTRSISTSVGAGLFLYALILHPLVAIASGRTIRAAEVFGIHPDPTVFATLGLLSLVPGSGASVLLGVPLAWCVVSWATLFAMGEPECWISFAVFCLSVGLRLALLAARSRGKPG
jgi:Family of unknown function (DUF6064)